MSDPVTALCNRTFNGTARIEEIGPLGMITLRVAPDTPGLAASLKSIAGVKPPAPRGIATVDDRSLAWMSPDEWLLILPHAGVAKAMKDMEKKMGDAPHLAVDVSDARAVFRITGAGAEGVVARLCPVDLVRLPEGEMRRTRMAQVACALWRTEGGFTLVAFRSVGQYVFDVLANAAV